MPQAGVGTPPALKTASSTAVELDGKQLKSLSFQVHLHNSADDSTGSWDYRDQQMSSSRGWNESSSLGVESWKSEGLALCVQFPEGPLPIFLSHLPHPTPALAHTSTPHCPHFDSSNYPNTFGSFSLFIPSLWEHSPFSFFDSPTPLFLQK